MLTIQTEIDIAATPDRVWTILMDFPGHGPPRRSHINLRAGASDMPRVARSVGTRVVGDQRRDFSEVGRNAGARARQPMADDNAVDPLGHGSTVWMQELDETRPLRPAMHVGVSVAREHVTARIEAALAAGGRIVDESHAPSHWTLADRAGNRVCICAWPDAFTQKPPHGRASQPTSGPASSALGSKLRVGTPRHPPGR